jgi:hypothetical protein
MRRWLTWEEADDANVNLTSVRKIDRIRITAENSAMHTRTATTTSPLHETAFT